MSQVISFTDYVPAARYDAVPWTKVRVEEGAASSGPWATIDTLNLSPLDSDPANPATRNLTITNASDTPNLWYRLTFIDGAGDLGEPSTPIQNAPGPHVYIAADSLKTTLELDTETYADADIATAIGAASQAIDAYKDTRFYPTFETRVYSPDRRYNSVEIDDLNGSTAITVTVDTDGDGVYETTWVQGTDFFFDPANANLTGKPYNRLTIRQQSGRVFPGWQRSLQIQASFGWANVPPQVTQAATVLSARYLKRARETPYGLLTIVGDAVAAARLGKIDPDVAFLLDDLGASLPQLIA